MLKILLPYVAMWSVLPFIDQGRLLTGEANMLPKKKSDVADPSGQGFLVGGVVLVSRGSLSADRYDMVATQGRHVTSTRQDCVRSMVIMTLC
jgi:hypothetical protein